MNLAKDKQIRETAPQAPDMIAVVAATKAAALRIGAYAVNDTETIQRMLDSGIVAFTSGCPDLALAARDGAA